MATCGTRGARRDHPPPDTRHAAPIGVPARPRLREEDLRAAGPPTITVRMKKKIRIGISPPARSWSISRTAGSLVVAGQKSGGVWALDPDNKGAVVWYSDISRGQILFGGAADEEQAYFALRGTYGGMAAIRLKDGLERWFADIPPQESMSQHPGLSAAVSVIPGVVFSAGLDGMLRAFSSFDGRPIWQYNTAKDFETVNGVKARGGSIGSSGATIVNGMVYVTSGYTGFQNGRPGNVLLAFSPAEQ